VAERLELVDEVAGLAVVVDAAGVVVGAEVVEAGGGSWPAIRLVVSTSTSVHGSASQPIRLSEARRTLWTV
jgi:hypothetical protein